MQASHGKFVVNAVVLQASDSPRRQCIKIFCLDAENLETACFYVPMKAYGYCLDVSVLLRIGHLACLC